MKLYLIRHGETEHNVQGLLAGVTDSRLTSHGVLQIQRLGEYFSKELRFTQIFSSDLQRAKMTAEAIRDAQLKRHSAAENTLEVIPLSVLREQDFGSSECLPWASKAANSDVSPDATEPGFKPKETKDAMRYRAEDFLNDYLTPLLYLDTVATETIAVVSHGLFLSTLWKALLSRLPPQSMRLMPELGPRSGTRPLEYLPAWSNTGYLELHFHPNPQDKTPADNSTTTEAHVSPKWIGWNVDIVTVNGKEHLSNLKRTRGGLGSVTYDARQRKLEGFFKKPKVDDIS